MKTQKVYGPPGTGKTRYLLERFEDELKTTPPNRVAFVTFTRAARLEALERSSRTEDELPFLRTIHSICYRQLQVSQSQMVKAKDLRYFGKQIGADLSGRSTDPWLIADDLGEFSFDPPSKDDQLLAINHLGRHRKATLKEALRDAPLDLEYRYAKWFTLAYKDWKSKESMLDYTDLLTQYLQRGAPLDVDVFFVDEAQDLSALQWDVVHKASAQAARVYCAGDDDQAIFTWAGASAEAFNSERADDVKTLDRSQRVPQRVSRVADRIIQRVRARKAKAWLPRDAEGEYHEVGYLSEGLFDGPFTYVLFRNHFRGKTLARELEELAIPYLGVGSPLSNDDVSTALRSYQRIARGESITSRQAWAIVRASKSDRFAVGAVAAAQTPNRQLTWSDLFVAQPSLDGWRRIMTRLPGFAYVDRVAARRGFDALLDPRVALLSIHQSKGREAHTVVIDRTLAKRTYDAYERTPDDEHRVWYVAVTRARYRLFSLMSSDTMAYEL